MCLHSTIYLHIFWIISYLVSSIIIKIWIVLIIFYITSSLVSGTMCNFMHVVISRFRILYYYCLHFSFALNTTIATSQYEMKSQSHIWRNTFVTCFLSKTTSPQDSELVEVTRGSCLKSRHSSFASLDPQVEFVLTLLLSRPSCECPSDTVQWLLR